tara:strand:- start:138 stop:1001 length:864 start_codon:yes stop_codon:yes gene_type:complete
MPNIISAKKSSSLSIFRNKSLSKNSKESYQTAVKKFHNYLKNSNREENERSLKLFLKKLKATKAPATFNLQCQALKEYLLEKYKKDPQQLFAIYAFFKNVKKAKVKKSVLYDGYLTIKELNKLQRKLSLKISYIVQALFWTGCRVSELINIKLSHIKITDMTIISIFWGKGEKQHTVYLPVDLYYEIKEIFKGKEYLFETKGGKKYHRANLYKEIKRQALRQGVNLHPHTLRHSKAMFLKNDQKLTPDQIAKALGHSSVLTTLQCYFHGTPSAKDQGIPTKTQKLMK